MTDLAPERRVFVCQHRTCAKDGAAQVLAAFQQQQIANVTVEACSCLGLCGSGPMVAIAPDQVYYWQVTPKKVAKIIELHLIGNTPIPEMMHPRLNQGN